MKYFFLILMTFNLFANETLVNKIVKKVDELYRSDSSHSRVEMTVKNPNWSRTLKMEMWTKGRKKTFIKILSPRKDAGVSTLRRGSDMWNYFPKIRKVLKVPPSLRMGSWMNSDFTNDDLVKETSLIDDYSSTLMKNEDSDFYFLELIPNEFTVSVWGKIIIKVEKKRLIPFEESFYDEKGKLTRIMTFKDIKLVDGKIMPMTIELIPLSKKGHKTIVKYIDLKFNKNISDSIFTRRNLEKK